MGLITARLSLGPPNEEMAACKVMDLIAVPHSGQLNMATSSLLIPVYPGVKVKSNMTSVKRSYGRTVSS